MKIAITSDPARIESFRRSFEEHSPADPLARFLGSLLEKFSFTGAERDLLLRRRGEAVPRLLEIAGSERNNLAVGAPAILALCLLKEPGVLPIARDTLKATDRDGWGPSYRHALFETEAQFLGTDPEICRQLLSRLDSNETRRVTEAVQECGILALPGAVDRFVELIRRPEVPARGRMAYWIAQHAPTREHLDLIGATWLDTPGVRGDDGAEILGTVAQLGEGGPPDLRDAAVEWLIRWFEEVRDGIRPLDFMSGTAVIYYALVALRRSAASDPRRIQPIADLIRAGNPVVETFLADALDVLAAGDPVEHRSLALEILGGEDGRHSCEAAKSLGRAHAGSGDPNLASAIRSARNRHGKAREYAEALTHIRRAGAIEPAEIDSGEHGPMFRVTNHWKARGLTLEQALTRMEQLGVLPETQAVERAAEARKAYQEQYTNREDETVRQFLLALSFAGILSEFDAEADVIPPPYDELILQISRRSGGRFVVEAARQDWDDDDSADEGWPTVEFLHEGRLYAFRPKDLGDWYDSGRLILAMNSALREAGRDDRFHILEGEGQEITLLLLSPEVANIVRKELFFPIAKAAETSRRPRKRS